MRVSFRQKQNFVMQKNSPNKIKHGPNLFTPCIALAYVLLQSTQEIKFHPHKI